jgi:hypothetical protein
VAQFSVRPPRETSAVEEDFNEPAGGIKRDENHAHLQPLRSHTGLHKARVKRLLRHIAQSQSRWRLFVFRRIIQMSRCGKICLRNSNSQTRNEAGIRSNEVVGQRKDPSQAFKFEF